MSTEPTSAEPDVPVASAADASEANAIATDAGGLPGAESAGSETTAAAAGATDAREPEADPEAEASVRSRKADLEREGEVAADFLESLMDIADLDGDLEVDVDGDRAAVSIVDSEEGSVPRRLIGPQGSALEALQELTRLAVQAETGDRSRLMLDVGGHREGRRQELIGVARKAVDRAKADGDRQPLDPMTAFERKVVHDEVLRSGLQSSSEGEEPRRFVVVMPAD
ncbi:MAG: R3H domain-containing nucleic acid-binding protein [Ornithinimicrobium sp.]